MKHLVLLTFISLAASAMAQTDSVTLKSGSLYIGKADALYRDRLTFTDSLGNKCYFMYDNIGSVSVKHLHTTFEGSELHLQYKSVIQLRSAFKGEVYKDQNAFLRNAGSLGIGATLSMLAGGILTAVGAATKTPTLTYSGAGVGGVGFILLVPTFYSLVKAGKATPYKPINL